jgi:hypothetical protein
VALAEFPEQVAELETGRAAPMKVPATARLKAAFQPWGLEAQQPAGIQGYLREQNRKRAQRQAAVRLVQQVATQLWVARRLSLLSRQADSFQTRSCNRSIYPC